MIETALGFWITALVYTTAAVVVVTLLDRLGWLRDTGIAETAWRLALWLGLLIATAGVVRAPLVDAWSFALTPTVILGAPSDTRVPLPVVPNATPSVPETRRAIATSSDEPAVASISLDGLPETAAQLVLALLGAFAATALFGLLRAWLAQQGLLRRADCEGRPAGAEWLAHRQALAPHRAYIRLREVRFLGSPIAVGQRDVLLPSWCGDLSADEQRALLAHELAHLERRDPLWRWLDAIAVALLAAHPLARHAERRLHELSEWACDAEAARRTGTPVALAQCLAECLEHLLPRTPALAVAMAEPAHGVLARVQRLLEERTMTTTPALAHFRRALIGIAIAAALAVPAIAITVEAGKRHGNSIEIRNGNGLFGATTMSASFNEPGRTLKIESEGTPQFSEDESRVIGFSGDGMFEISDTHNGVTRELRVAGTNSVVKTRYRVDGVDAAMDATAQQWLAATLPEMFRRTGLDAEARAARIHTGGGVDALLDEIAQIPADYSRATYLGMLFKLAKLDDVQLTRAIDLATAIESDHELGRALSLALANGTLEEAAAAAVLAAAKRIGSDFERAELLIAASAQVAMNITRAPAWRSAVEDIGSDYEKRRVLTALIDAAPDNPETVSLAIAMAATIGSDFEARSLLQHALAGGPVPAVSRAEYIAAVDTIGSDYERRQALTFLIREGEVDSALALDVLTAAAEIGSDHETMELLAALAQVMPNDTRVIDAYRALARRLSTHARGQAEQALDRFAEV
jgi:beta-lactamase regulating signal transducer with metallopeptidase domain